MKHPLHLIAVSFALLAASAAALADVSGVVIEVVDGDTISVLINGREQRVRLAEIDAPEPGQKYTQTSRKALHDLVFGKTVRLLPISTDPQGTSVAYVRLGQIDASLEQVRRGMAWPHDQLVWDQNIIAAGESARRAKVGLWRDSSAVPPWAYRKDGPRALAAPVPGRAARPAIARQQEPAPRRTSASRAKAPPKTAVVERNAEWRTVPYRGEAATAARNRGAALTQPGVAHSQVDSYLRQIQDAQTTRNAAGWRR